MASRPRKPSSGGRVTPKAGAQEASKVATTSAKAHKRPSALDPEAPVKVGRRPSSPGFLALVAVMWLAVGVILFLTLSTGWRLIPAIVAFGIGLMFLRGAGSTVLRRERRRSSEK